MLREYSASNRGKKAYYKANYALLFVQYGRQSSRIRGVPNQGVGGIINTCFQRSFERSQLGLSVTAGLVVNAWQQLKEIQ